jgi:hypothetical protein
MQPARSDVNRFDRAQDDPGLRPVDGLSPHVCHSHEFRLFAPPHPLKVISALSYIMPLAVKPKTCAAHMRTPVLSFGKGDQARSASRCPISRSIH